MALSNPPLAAELKAFKTAWAERAGAEIADTIALDIEALRQSGILARALMVGARFPALRLPDARGQSVDLATVMARGPMVVTVYRGGWCPYCNLELRAYQRRLDAIQALGATVVAVSPEAPDHSLSTAEKNDLAFPVLSDTQGRLADALGIRFPLSPQIEALYRRFGHDLPSHNGDGRWSLPIPATYVVDRGGEIRLASIEPDYRLRLDPEGVIALLADLHHAKRAA
ncbi:MAG: AhpC/TSA family protein [Alphaproteobacteria bacterium]|nr:peroxiredoxin-like family protein [Alphaproteobacteria bacterium]TAD89973.1 MAG: AhpC/TSA family protein [Alphaproteobacteria bacterium]